MSETEAPTSDRAFAARFFNDTWSYLEKPKLNPDEADAMLHCCHASFHHWTRAEGSTPENLAIGYWQLARVYEKAGISEACGRYAARCLAIAESQAAKPALMVGAREVGARAAAMRGDRAERDRLAGLAQAALKLVPDPEDRKVYQADIDTIP